MATDIADVDVIIAVRDSGGGLGQPLRARSAQVRSGAAVIVVDPGSADAAINAVTAGHPRVHFHPRTDAVGDAAAIGVPA